MKKGTIHLGYKFLLVILFSFFSVLSFAQENTNTNSGSGNSGESTSITKETTSTSTTTTDWYTQPWVWVVGGALVVIILVALLRGNNSSTREVNRTTVIKDDRL